MHYKEPNIEPCLDTKSGRRAEGGDPACQLLGRCLSTQAPALDEPQVRAAETRVVGGLTIDDQYIRPRVVSRTNAA